jgi:hypothetical protein
MRTTLALEDDAVYIAKRHAEFENLSLGQAVSEMIRIASRVPKVKTKPALRGRFALLPERGVQVTPEYINELMDAEGVLS